MTNSERASSSRRKRPPVPVASACFVRAESLQASRSARVVPPGPSRSPRCLACHSHMLLLHPFGSKGALLQLCRNSHDPKRRMPLVLFIDRSGAVCDRCDRSRVRGRPASDSQVAALKGGDFLVCNDSTLSRQSLSRRPQTNPMARAARSVADSTRLATSMHARMAN